MNRNRTGNNKQQVSSNLQINNIDEISNDNVNQFNQNNQQENQQNFRQGARTDTNPFLFSGNEKTDDDNKDQLIENVKQVGSVTDVNPVKDICFISIIGEIEGHTSLPPQSKTTKYEHIIPMVIGAEMDPQIKGILLLINTVGGDVEAGLAISELIASITKPTVSIVLGGGHSIGTALAVSARNSFIAPTGTMTIHPIRTNVLLLEFHKHLDIFKKCQERITNFIVANSHVNRDAFLNYMYDTDEIANDVGTVLNAQEVVDIGLIDQIGGFSAAMKSLRDLIDNMNNQ